MKRISVTLRNLVATFFVLGALLVSANLVSAQCGNYFRTNYQVISKLNPNIIPFGFSDAMLDDWTGDGRSDLWNFRWNASTPGYDVVIYPAKPTGYWDWDTPIVYTTTISPSPVTQYEVKDTNGDGRMDLIYGSGNFFRIHRNNGNGSLIPSPVLTDSDGGISSNGSMGFADLNGDNLLDWLYAFGSQASAQIRYQLQNPDGTFGNKTTVLSASADYGNSFVSNRLGDFDGDGKIDILYNTEIGGTFKYVFMKNLGNGNFQIRTPVEMDLYVSNTPAKDFNNDGRADILSRNIIFYGRADGTFDRVQLPGGSASTYNMRGAELSGDHNLDVIEIGSDYYATYISNGAGGFTRTFYQKNLESFMPLKFEDFSGDGKADIYQINLNDRNFNKNIFGEKIIVIKESMCQSSGETKTANFDGNVKSDLTMWNPNTGNWSSKNVGWYPEIDPNTRVFNWGLGTHGDVPAPGDFDGDGKTDYAVYRNSTGYWYIFKSSDSSWLVFPFGLADDIPVPADYDGGGKTDIAVFRPADGNWYFWFSETQQFLALHFGASGDKPVPADYDGDKKTDVAVYRPSEGNWYYLKSSDGNYAVFNWGIATDKPLPADYDGDGRADLTIYRDGSWWIWRSSNNLQSVVQWGQPNDIPMPVYRNSVSADLILYRPSTNFWYSYDSKIVGGIAFGGNGDIPIYFGLPN